MGGRDYVVTCQLLPLNIGFQHAFPHAPPPPPPLLNTGMHSPGSSVEQAGCNPEAAQIVQTWSKHGPPTSLLPHSSGCIYKRGGGDHTFLAAAHTCAPNCFG